MSYRPYGSLTSSGISDSRTNVSGITMPKGIPVRITNTGDINFINVSIEAQALAIFGITSTDISNLSSGSIITSGKVTDIATSASFGDLMYINKSGYLTNIKPSIGVEGFVSGDFVVSVGVIAKNDSNPSAKDLVILIDVIGQL